MEKILITGGAGFIGSQMADFFVKKGKDVTIFDNLSRWRLLYKRERYSQYVWDQLRKHKQIRMIKGDVSNFGEVESACKGADLILHAAAQTAVTSSLRDPVTDFNINALGTLNVLEAARKSSNAPVIIYCSTNKVYGENVDKVAIRRKKKRYVFAGDFRKGISENFPVDQSAHTPYGCSKLAGDLYMQEYGRLYGLHTGVFRMSCIYGPRQFGVEDQGWVAWFATATITGKPITIYGDGKQVRDILYVEDLVEAFNSFFYKGKKLAGEVFNIGGGPANTVSLLELLDLLEKITGKRSEIRFDKWRPSDQKVYVSDIRKVEKNLSWTPKITPKKGLKKLTCWILKNRTLFDR